MREVYFFAKCIPVCKFYTPCYKYYLLEITRFPGHFLLIFANFSKKLLDLHFIGDVKKTCLLTLIQIVTTCFNNGIHIKKMSRHIHTESSHKMFTTLTLCSLLLNLSAPLYPTERFQKGQ